MDEELRAWALAVCQSFDAPGSPLRCEEPCDWCLEKARLEIEEERKYQTTLPLDDKLQMVAVDISKTIVAPLPPIEYMILLNRSPNYIREVADRNSRVFLIPIMTMNIENVPDCNSLADLYYVIAPLYLGGVKELSLVVDEWVKCYLSPYETRCLLNEVIEDAKET